MRFSIVLASMNIAWILKRIAESQGLVLPETDQPSSSFFAWIVVIFVLMDISEFLKGLIK